MNIAISGSSGFLGRELLYYYANRDKNNSFKLIQRNISDSKKSPIANSQIVKFDFSRDDVSSLAGELKDCDLFFHCAFSPGLADDLSAKLLDIYQKANPRGKFIYFSSLNVLIPSLAGDPYTKEKTRQEIELLRVKPIIPALVVRPSFLISRKIPEKFSIFINYAKRFHVVALLSPGPSHYFLVVESLLRHLDKEVSNFNQPGFNFLNISGSNLISLSELIRKMIKDAGIPALMVKIPTRPARILLSCLPVKPLWLKKKMKLLEDTCYSPVQVSQRTMLPDDILGVKFTI